jgi:hypothetical protein
LSAAIVEELELIWVCCGWRVPGNDSIPIVQESWWAPGPVWTGAENLPPPHPPGFDPRTSQPVASRYTDCVIPALGASTTIRNIGGGGGLRHLKHNAADFRWRRYSFSASEVVISDRHILTQVELRCNVRINVNRRIQVYANILGRVREMEV